MSVKCSVNLCVLRACQQSSVIAGIVMLYNLTLKFTIANAVALVWHTDNFEVY